MNLNEQLRKLPSVDKLLSSEEIVALMGLYPRDDIIIALRESLEFERKRILSGEALNFNSREEISFNIIARARGFVERKNTPSLVRVINGTGIMIHTNLGRAILPESAISLATEAARGYSNLEFDLKAGERGDRMMHLRRHLVELTGAEDALAVNNNAAALLLILDTFAKGKEVIVSRGELIEIGGSFRLPDILRKGGARLVEVGCTNKTYLEDYESAITENTAILLKSHASNYVIKGFTHETPGCEVAKLARKYNLLSVEDMGSGLMIDLSKYGLTGEPTCRELIESGLDLITFSGDKLLGGPQCGIILGSKKLIKKLAKNPLTRALRLDKMTIAAMEGTLLLYRNPDKLEERLPLLRMLAQRPEEIMHRTQRIIEALKKETAKDDAFTMEKGSSRTGGGAFPDTEIPSFILCLEHNRLSAHQLYLKLLSGKPPVVGRIYKDKMTIDIRTVLPEEEGELIGRVAEIYRENM